MTDTSKPLTVPQIAALHYLSGLSNGASFTDLNSARHAPITIDALEKLGMVKKTPDRTGTNIWRITGVGRAALDKVGR